MEDTIGSEFTDEAKRAWEAIYKVLSGAMMKDAEPVVEEIQEVQAA